MNPNLVILGAGKPRFSEALASNHNIIGSKVLLDKQLDVFGERILHSVYVNGYGSIATEVSRNDVTFIQNRYWRSTGSLYSLNLALQKLYKPGYELRDTYVIYSDIFFNSTAIDRLCVRDENVVTIGTVDAKFGYYSYSDELLPLESENLAFSGIMKISAEHLKNIMDISLDISRKQPKSTVGRLVSKLLTDNKIPISLMSIDDCWAHIEKTETVNRFIFGTKAQNLISLSNKVQKSKIPHLLSIKFADFNENEERIIENIVSFFNESKKLVVRSSSKEEDSFKQSNAGAYESILGVELEYDTILKAITRVFGSYESWNFDDEVIVQNQIFDVSYSGVIFTRSLQSLAPYYEINLSRGPNTAAITSGETNDFEHYVISREAYASVKDSVPREIKVLVDAAKEIEKLCGYSALDIEFAVGQDGTIYTLQVRPLVSHSPIHEINKDKKNNTALIELEKRLFKRNKADSRVLGGAPVWSNMSDWNPAEIIGTRPNPLAFSLYRYLITDEVWAQQRHDVGYRDLRGEALISDFYNHPYVDVGASFSSFIPRDVDDSVAEKLVEFALSKLRKNPHLHDRVEFDFFPTSTNLISDDKLLDLSKIGILNQTEVSAYSASLLNVTNAIIDKLPESLKLTEKLEEPSKFNGNLATFPQWLNRSLKECIEFGTLPFAHLARAGFVAISYLNSLASKGLLEEGVVFDILESFDGLGNYMQNVAAQCMNGTISTDEFINIFGHLRPGTYDITVPAYWESPDVYLYPILSTIGDPKTKIKREKVCTKEELDCYIFKNKIFANFSDLRNFCESAINARELAKFRFSKQVSIIIDGIRDFGVEIGLTAEDLQYTRITDFLYLEGSVLNSENLKALIEKRRQEFLVNSELKFANVLKDPIDLKYFKEMDATPSFITNKIIEGKIIKITKETQLSTVDLSEKILVIENADPGYDFVFSRKISGFITCFGGPNSHMAIRSAELGIPAVIGVGNKIFNKFIDNQLVRLNCMSKKIEWLEI